MDTWDSIVQCALEQIRLDQEKSLEVTVEQLYYGAWMVNKLINHQIYLIILVMISLVCNITLI